MAMTPKPVSAPGSRHDGAHPPVLDRSAAGNKDEHRNLQDRTCPRSREQGTDVPFCMIEIGKRHGDRCTCRLLVEAMGFNPAILSFSFCRSVLQQRWEMHCNHGEIAGGEQQERGKRWQGLGQMDAVKALLVKNG